MNIDPTWFLTAISLSGTILNVRKSVWCFYVWLIGDILWCTFDFMQGMYGRSLLDFIQIILAFCGIISWRKGKEKQMKIENKLVSQLKAHPKNPRKHPKELIERLKKSIQEYGFTNPVLVSKDNHILAGHARCKAAKELGINEVPTLKLDFEGAKADAYVIIDNKLNEMSEWDVPVLVDLIKEIEQSDFDVSLTGFDEDEILDLFSNADVKEGKDDNFDVNKALEEATFVKPGDLWQLGKHRMLCGDATNAEDLKRLMENEKANLVVTDPPYNVNFESASGLKIKNDKQDNENFYQFLLSSFKNMAEHLAEGASAYIFHADTEGLNFRKAFIESGFHLSGVCIWAKNSFVMGRSPYQWGHENQYFMVG